MTNHQLDKVLATEFKIAVAQPELLICGMVVAIETIADSGRVRTHAVLVRKAVQVSVGAY